MMISSRVTGAVLPEPILKQVTAFNTREALLTEHLWTVTLDSQKILNIASKEDTNDVMPVNLFFRFTFSLFLSGYSWLFSTERGRKTSGTLEMKGLWSPLSVSCIHDLKKIMLPRIASPVYTVYIIFFSYFWRNAANVVSANAKVEHTSSAVLPTLNPKPISAHFKNLSSRHLQEAAARRSVADWHTWRKMISATARHSAKSPSLGPIDTSEDSVFSARKPLPIFQWIRVTHLL